MVKLVFFFGFSLQSVKDICTSVLIRPLPPLHFSKKGKRKKGLLGKVGTS